MTPRSDQDLRDRAADLKDAASERFDDLSEAFDDRLEAAQERIHDLIEDVKPKLRGWLHLVTLPVVLIAGLTLTSLAPTVSGRVGAAVYTFTAVLLFGVSAVYHRGNGWWDRRTHLFLKHLDHSNIFFLVAGSTTPFALLLLEGAPRVILLSLMGSIAILGTVLKFAWESFPRWLSTLFYLAMGWLPVGFIGEFMEGAQYMGGAGVAVLSLIAGGGILYTLGGVIYGLKRPNPWPTVWGFHENFHLFTVLAFICHYIAVSLVVFSV